MGLGCLLPLGVCVGHNPENLLAPLPARSWNVPSSFHPWHPLPPASGGLSKGLGAHSPWLQAGDGPQGDWDLSQGCCLQEVTVASAPRAPRGGVYWPGGRAEEEGEEGGEPQPVLRSCWELLEFLSCAALCAFLSRHPTVTRFSTLLAPPSHPMPCCVLTSGLQEGLMPGPEDLLPTEAGQGQLLPGPLREASGSSQRERGTASSGP